MAITGAFQAGLQAPGRASSVGQALGQLTQFMMQSAAQGREMQFKRKMHEEDIASRQAVAGMQRQTALDVAGIRAQPTEAEQELQKVMVKYFKRVGKELSGTGDAPTGGGKLPTAEDIGAGAVRGTLKGMDVELPTEFKQRPPGVEDNIGRYFTARNEVKKIEQQLANIDPADIVKSDIKIALENELREKQSEASQFGFLAKSSFDRLNRQFPDEAQALLQNLDPQTVNFLQTGARTPSPAPTPLETPRDISQRGIRLEAATGAIQERNISGYRQEMIALEQRARDGDFGDRDDPAAQERLAAAIAEIKRKYGMQ